MNFEQGKEIHDRLQVNLGKVIKGKQDVITMLLTAMLSEGHVLLEDVPGTGKTKLSKALSKSVGADFSRIQFTPDLLPGDVTGLNIYSQKDNEFHLRKGPVFTNILLGDEINRATPRTQSGLLEAMEERQVTIDGETLSLPSPFFVMATQNPLEQAGTFPLPEAQIDRFIMKLHMGMPDEEAELDMLKAYETEDPLDSLETVISTSEWLEACKTAKKIHVAEVLQKYMLAIVRATRETPTILNGVSPRGGLSLQACAKTYAFLQGRGYVIPDDIKAVAIPVLSHRLILSVSYSNRNSCDSLLNELIDHIPVPTEEFK